MTTTTSSRLIDTQTAHAPRRHNVGKAIEIAAAAAAAFLGTTTSNAKGSGKGRPRSRASGTERDIRHAAHCSRCRRRERSFLLFCVLALYMQLLIPLLLDVLEVLRPVKSRPFFRDGRVRSWRRRGVDMLCPALHGVGAGRRLVARQRPVGGIQALCTSCHPFHYFLLRTQRRNGRARTMMGLLPRWQGAWFFFCFCCFFFFPSCDCCRKCLRRGAHKPLHAYFANESSTGTKESGSRGSIRVHT